MSAGTYNDTIEQGANWTRTLTYKDDDGNAIDITGYDARLTIRRRKHSDTALLTLDVGSGITITGASGLITLEITAAQAAALDYNGHAVYDLELYPGGNADASDDDTIRLLEGRLHLSREVTK